MNNQMQKRVLARARGFSLIELAISLAVLATVMGAIMVPLGSQVDQRNVSQTQKTLTEINEALIGYALKNGRLPCPASATSNGVESPVGGTAACTNPYNGFVPAATLGLTGVDAEGYAVDAWGARIRYAVSTANGGAFTLTNGMRAARMAALSPELVVCPTSAGIAASNCGAGAVYLTNSAVAVLHSLGRNWATTNGVSADEAANVNGDAVFVSHGRSDADTARGEFDDVITWLPTGVLFSRMVGAGQLP